MQHGAELKAGVLMVLALAALAGITVFFRAMGVGGRVLEVEFGKVLPITEGSEVLYQGGVNVGTVEEVAFTPDNRVRIRMRLRKDVPIYENTGFEVRMKSLLGQYYVLITNPTPRAAGPELEGNLAQGIDAYSWDELLPRFEQMVNRVDRLTQAIEAVVGDPKVQQSLRESAIRLAETTKALHKTVTDPQLLKPLQETLSSINEAAKAVAQLTGDPQLSGGMKRTLAQFELASQRLADGIPKALGELEQTGKAVRELVGDPEFVQSVKGTAQTLNAASQELQRLLSDEELMGKLKQAVTNIETATSSLSALTQDPEFLSSIKRTAQNAEKVTASGTEVIEEVKTTVASAKETLQELRPQLEGTLKRLNRMSENLEDTTEVLNFLIKEGGLGQNIQQAVKDFRDSAADIKASAASIKELLTDPDFKGRLRKSIENIEEVTGEAKDVAPRVRKLVSEIEKPFGVFGTLKFSPRLSLWSIPEKNRFISDLDLTFRPKRSRTFFDLGMHNIAESGRLNLQVGQFFGRDFAGRVGFYRDEPGVGLDFQDDRFGLSVNAFDTERFKWNAWLRFRLFPDFWLRFGGEDLSRRKLFGVGVDYGR